MIDCIGPRQNTKNKIETVSLNCVLDLFGYVCSVQSQTIGCGSVGLSVSWRDALPNDLTVVLRKLSPLKTDLIPECTPPCS